MDQATHIMLAYPSQETYVLCRASDGILIGECQKATVVFGVEPQKKTSRVFLDHSYALKFLRFVATLDTNGVKPLMDYEKLECGTATAIIDERDQEGLVVIPPDTLEMRTNGGGLPTVMPYKHKLSN